MQRKLSQQATTNTGNGNFLSFSRRADRLFLINNSSPRSSPIFDEVLLSLAGILLLKKERTVGMPTFG